MSNVSLLALHSVAVETRTARDRALEAKYDPDAGDGAHERFISSYAAAEAAEAALVAALSEADWGTQADGSFVTRTSPIASTRYTRTLHAPGRQGPLAVVTRRFARTALSSERIGAWRVSRFDANGPSGHTAPEGDLA